MFYSSSDAGSSNTIISDTGIYLTSGANINCSSSTINASSITASTITANSSITTSTINGYYITKPSSGTNAYIPTVSGSDAGMEIGQYLDFHVNDYEARISVTGTNKFSIDGSLIPAGDNSKSLGDDSNAWSSVFCNSLRVQSALYYNIPVITKNSSSTYTPVKYIHAIQNTSSSAITITPATGYSFITRTFTQNGSNSATVSGSIHSTEGAGRTLTINGYLYVILIPVNDSTFIVA